MTDLPHVIAKAAVTLDGRMATRSGDSRWITGIEARTEAHRMRARADAVLVGIGTVIADDPSLTVRHVEGEQPIRVVLDTHLRLAASAKLLSPEAPTWVAHGPGADTARCALLRDAGAILIETPLAGARLDIEVVLRELKQRGVARLLVEGGAQVHGALLDARLVHELAVFIAPKLLADPEARPLAFGAACAQMSDAWSIREPKIEVLGRDVLIRGSLDRGSREGYE